MRVGTEILVDASGCNPDALRDLARVRALLENVLVRCELRVVGEGQWHAFGGEGGVTGLYLLTESHLAVHTYPEHGTATLNLYCCRAHTSYPWEAELARAFGGPHHDVRVVVRTLDRGS
jgi:S-adenosylmethionine decarboxylase